MTVTLDINPELEARLIIQARASGVSVEAYVRSVLENVLLPATEDAATADGRAAAFESWAAAHRFTPPLSDFAVSREGMYEDSDR